MLFSLLSTKNKKKRMQHLLKLQMTCSFHCSAASARSLMDGSRTGTWTCIMWHMKFKTRLCFVLKAAQRPAFNLLHRRSSIWSVESAAAWIKLERICLVKSFGCHQNLNTHTTLKEASSANKPEQSWQRIEFVCCPGVDPSHGPPFGPCVIQSLPLFRGGSRRVAFM